MNIEEIESLNIMSNPFDLLVEELILKTHQPKNILEMGLGMGGWSIFSNKLTGAKVVGVENFDFINYDNYGSAWIRDKKELEASLEKHDICIKETITEIPENIVFDLVRLDCLDQEKDIKEFWDCILPKTSKECLFFVDDIIPRITLFRFLYMMKLCEVKILKPVWMGEKEGVWCKYDYDCSEIHNAILSGNLSIRKYHLNIGDENQTILISTP
jgi:hypothetical protein